MAKFVKQTKTGEEGNCLEACMASLTGIPIKDFPEYDIKNVDGGEQFAIINNWLTENHSIYIESLTCYLSEDLYYDRGLVIAIGYSPVYEGLLHAVIWDVMKSKLVFDPSPKNKGLLGDPKYYCIIVNHYKMDN